MSWICTEQKKKKRRLGTWKWIAIISINEAHKVKLSNRLELSPRLEFIWNLAILCGLYTICVITEIEKVKLLSTAKEATADEPGLNENFIRRRISARVINIFMKQFQFRMALFHPLFTLGTLKTATIFLDPNTCLAEDIWPRAKNAMCTWC